MASQSGGGDDYEIGGINVTPLVDVMLVLLIIFMVTATYIVKEAMPIELPVAKGAAPAPPRTMTILIDKTGQISLDGVRVAEAELGRKLDSVPVPRSEVQVLVGADRETDHGRVVGVLDLLQSKGIGKFAIQVQREPQP